MKRFVQGDNRTQSFLLPEAIVGYLFMAVTLPVASPVSSRRYRPHALMEHTKSR